MEILYRTMENVPWPRVANRGAGRSSGPATLDRVHRDNRCLAGPFENRCWTRMEPLAASSRRAVHPPRHRLGLCLERLQDPAGEIAPHLRNRRRDAVHHRHCDGGPSAGGVRHARRPLRGRRRATPPCWRPSRFPTGSRRSNHDYPSTAAPPDRRVRPTPIVLAWLWVALPFAYGVWQLFTKITQLFGI